MQPMSISIEEIFTRLTEVGNICKYNQNQVSLYLERTPVKLSNPYSGYNPLKNPFIGQSVINLSPPQVFVSPWLLAPVSEQRYSQWGIKMYLANFQRGGKGEEGKGEAGGEGGGTAKGLRVHRDEMKNPAKQMKR